MKYILILVFFLSFSFTYRQTPDADANYVKGNFIKTGTLIQMRDGAHWNPFYF